MKTLQQYSTNTATFGVFRPDGQMQKWSVLGVDQRSSLDLPITKTGDNGPPPTQPVNTTGSGGGGGGNQSNCPSCGTGGLPWVFLPLGILGIVSTIGWIISSSK